MNESTKEEESSAKWFCRNELYCKILNTAIKTGKLLIVLILLFTNAVTAKEDSASSQSRTDKKKLSIEENIKRLNAIANGETTHTKKNPKDLRDQDKEADPAKPEPPSAIISNPVTLKKYQASLQAYYDYRTSGLEHRRQVFKWQLFSAKLIFGVVVFLVLAGIAFAWLQFKAGLDTTDSGGEMEKTATEFEASSDGIKVSSPVLGVIILVISLAFFYLYLVHVYPIEDIF